MTVWAGNWQQKCPQSVPILEGYLDALHEGGERAAEMPKLRGSGCYVVPALRHWPVWSPTENVYVDAANYVVDDARETRESMLTLSREEAWSLAPIRISVDTKQERGKLTSASTYTLKKWGISRAEWRRSPIAPDARNLKLVAAFEWLKDNNRTYATWVKRHVDFLKDQERFSVPRYWLRTSDLLLKCNGVEVAAFPILYPRACFGDTNMRDLGLIDEACEKSIFTSHLRKLLSPCVAYIMKPELTFLLYDIGMARRLTLALSVAEKRGFSGDIATDHYTDSESYWRHEQDISCDMVRQMSVLGDVVPGEDADRTIYEFCHNESSPGRLAFPNFFITIAPAQWLFPLPAWLKDLAATNLSDVSGVVALHIYHVLMVSLKSILCEGVWFSSVFHYCMRIEFQGRGTIHVHVALWAIARDGMDLSGRVGDHYPGGFVTYLSKLYGGCKVDVQLGSGWLNYINGYVNKGHDSMDFRVKDHFKDKETNAPWRQTYRLLCKKAPLFAEVYLAMKKRPMMERSFLTDVLCAVIPGKIDVMVNAVTKHHLTYRTYLRRSVPVTSAEPSLAGAATLAHRKGQISLLVRMLFTVRLFHCLWVLQLTLTGT